MTREEAITNLNMISVAFVEPITKEQRKLIDDTFEMAISALENIGHLKNRPCSVCEFHKENGCCKWTCVFTDRLFGDMR